MNKTEIVRERMYCTVAEFANECGVSNRTIERRISDGIIPILPKKKGQKTLINLRLLQKRAEQAE
ncbi:hypothetical protein GMA8713_02755 [Grimontia marina]|uniref:Uncharacterized protein n=1 Tax=Grimontia marina TaxID=646534 RepID=A0A128FA66_9GAMM|nr:hypothetical protein GMA8713_02755 [Grimontia marina]